MNKNKIVFFILVFFLKASIMAQISGISASKLQSFCVDVVDHKNLEFEPAFSVTRTSKHWDADGNLQNSYNLSGLYSRSSSMQFRFTYGLFDKFEIGTIVPVSMDRASLGVRYILFEKSNLGIALIAGSNIPLGNQLVDRKIEGDFNYFESGLGGVVSYQFSENISLDFNAQYNSYLRRPNNRQKSFVSVSTDLGYYLLDKQLQIIGAVAYNQSAYNTLNSNLLTFIPGFIIETGERYLIVFSTPIDILGKNIDRTINFNFALTTIID